MKKVILGAFLCTGTSMLYAQQLQKNKDTVSLQPVEVSAVKAGDNAPFAKTNFSKKDIEKVNLGQDLPFVLDQTPSVIINSDAGNGVGYTGIHIRGTDATRINVTLNGIPYNDAESSGTYFVDVPDLVSSADNIQIQRGVGTSSNGAGAFGASINISTNEYNEKPYAETDNSFGSFNTWKNTIKVGSGLLNGHFTLDARLSQITSDGYIDRAATNLKSFYLSAAYITKTSSVRFNILSGKERTYQAWDGVPQDSLATNRTYNDLGTEKPGAPYSNQTDNYQQDHYQLFFNHTFSDKLTFSTAAFMVYGRGYYQEYKGVAAETNAGDNSATSYAYYGLPNPVINGDTITNTDLTRQLWLDNHFYGQTASLQYKTKKDEVIVSGEWTRYQGSHSGNITWAQNGGTPTDDYQYYNYPVLKTDITTYVKWQHQLNTNWQSFIDIQYRNVYHRIDGFEGNSVQLPIDTVSRNFNFVNPKAGITYTKNNWQAYFSYAMANKEPNHDDFANTVTPPTYETLHDFELGVERKQKKYSWGVNVYYMKYINQLILTGQLNSVGSPIRVNVPNSYRLGVELQGATTITHWLNITANATFSQNKIKLFTGFLSEYDASYNYIGQKETQYANTTISYSPSVIAGGSINFIPVKHGEISLISKYVSKQYLDNTADDSRSVAAYYAQNVRLTYSLENKIGKKATFIFQVNNLFSAKYNSTGSAYPDIENGQVVNYNYYFPMALINYMAGVNFSL